MKQLVVKLQNLLEAKGKTFKIGDIYKMPDFVRSTA